MWGWLRRLSPFARGQHCPTCGREHVQGDNFHSFNQRGLVFFSCPSHCPVCASNARQDELERAS